MPVSAVLYQILTAGAVLMAEGAAGEFAKGAGKAAFEKLRTLLGAKHDVKSLALLEDAPDNPGYAAAIKGDLDKPDIAADAEVLALAETLRAAIAAIPEPVLAAHSVDIKAIRAGRDIIIRANEGVRARDVEAGGKIVIEGNTTPGN